MPLQTSGQISLSQIQSEYGGANNISISEYYNNTPNTTPTISTSRISKIRMKGVSGTIDQNAAIREFEFDGLGDWGAGDRRTGNNQIIITTNINTISDLNADLNQQPININVDLVTINSADRYTLTGTDSLENEFQNTPSHIASLQTINIIKGAELTLDINTTLTHPFIIVESKYHYGNDSNRYETGVTYSTLEYETNKGQITGSIIWDTSTSVLGLYYGICINHSAMYFVINLQHSSESLEPPLNSWINGSKELDSRSLMGNGLTINNNYYIEFDFVGSATKPLVNDFDKLKIFWDKSDISQDGDMGTWEICVYNQDNAQLVFGNITLTENNIITTVVSSQQELIYDFTPYDTNASWTTYLQTIPNSTSSAPFYSGGTQYPGIFNFPSPDGFISIILPSAYNNLEVTFGNHDPKTTSQRVELLINDVIKSTAYLNEYSKTYIQKYIGNDVLKIIEYNSQIHKDLIIKLTNVIDTNPVITPSVQVNTIGNANTIIFQNTGDNQTSYDITFSENTICDILIVGGGGGGGTPNGASYKSGGGGAGGMVYVVSQYLLANITYKIKVGNGGIYHNKGFDSLITDSANNIITLDNISMQGLGGGAGAPQNISDDAKNGGSGGGGGHYISGGQGLQGNTVWDNATSSYVKGGNDGWNYPSGSSGFHADYGGGAGVNGAGKAIDITGTSVVYATGGDYLGDATATNGTQHLGNGGNGRFCNSGNCGTAKGGNGGSGIIIIRYLNTITTSHHLEFNLGTPSAIVSGGYVTNVGYIPSYSQPYVAINFSDFYYQAPPSSGPPTPVASSIPGASGGLGSTSYEIITGLYANNTTRTEGTTSFDNRGAGGRGSSNNVSYSNLIIQAKPGDVLNLIGRINTSGTFQEYCEFWVWLGGSWSRFSSPVASFLGNRDFSVNYTIPLSTVAGNYALAVACSYYTLGASAYRSWKSYSLHVWT